MNLPIPTATSGLLTLAALLVSGCDSSTTGSLAPPLGNVVVDELEPLGGPVVDQPGRITQWVRAFGPSFSGSERAPIAGLTAEDFTVSFQGSPLPAEAVSNSELPGGSGAAVVYVLLDRLPEEAGIGTLPIEEAIAASASTWTDVENLFVKVAWFDGSGLLEPLIPLPSDVGFTEDLDALLVTIATPAAPVTDGSARLDAMAEAAEQIHGFVATSEALTFAERVDRFLLVVDGGEADTSELSPAHMPVLLAGVESTVFNLASGPGDDLGPDNGYAEVFLGGVEPLESEVSTLAESQAALVNAAYRVSFLPDLSSLSPSGTETAFLSVQSGSALLPEGGGVLAAGLQVTFSSLGLGPGAALIEPEPLAVDLLSGPVVEVVQLADGRSRVLVSRPNGGLVFGLDANGALDPEFGIEGKDAIAGSSPPGGLGSGWSASPIGLSCSPDGQQTYLVTQWTREADSRMAIYQSDGTGPAKALLVPPIGDAGNDYASGLVRDSSGRLLVYGQSGPSPEATPQLFAARFSDDLFFDLLFGSDGKLVFEPSGACEFQTVRDAETFELDGLDYYVFVGEEKLAGADSVEARIVMFGPGGSLTGVGSIGGVPGFSGGTALGSQFLPTDLAFGDARATALEVDVLGRFCFAGDLPHPTTGVRIPVAWRVTLPGLGDPNLTGGPENVLTGDAGPYGLGAVGLDLTRLPNGGELFTQDVAIEDFTLGPDGAWLLAGSRVSEDGTDALLIRLLPNGAVDTSFNGVGYWLEDGTLGPGRSEQFSEIEVSPFGELLTFGRSLELDATPESDEPRLIHFRDDDPSRAYQP